MDFLRELGVLRGKSLFLRRHQIKVFIGYLIVGEGVAFRKLIKFNKPVSSLYLGMFNLFCQLK
jgi:hypothetical protein